MATKALKTWFTRWKNTLEKNEDTSICKVSIYYTPKFMVVYLNGDIWHFSDLPMSDEDYNNMTKLYDRVVNKKYTIKKEFYGYEPKLRKIMSEGALPQNYWNEVE